MEDFGFYPRTGWKGLPEIKTYRREMTMGQWFLATARWLMDEMEG